VIEGLVNNDPETQKNPVTLIV